MSKSALGPLPPPADASFASNAFPKARGAKDLIRATAQYQWRRKKQDMERRSIFKLQGQRSLSKLHGSRQEAGLISADVYDPSLQPRYACPTSFDEDPELEPMVRRVNNMKKLNVTMQNFCPPSPEWEFSRVSPPEVQDWISKTLASAPKLPEPEVKVVVSKARPKKSRRRRSSTSMKDKALVAELTEDGGFAGEDWGELSDSHTYFNLIKAGKVLSDEHVQSIRRIFENLSDSERQHIHKDVVHKALEEFGILDLDRNLLARITNEVAPYSQVDLRDLTDIIEKWLAIEHEFMKETFDAMDKDGTGTVSAQELFQFLGSVGITPVRSRVREVVQLVDPDCSGTLGFPEVVQLILLYRHTEGFSLKEVKVLRGICAREAHGQKGLPRFKLKDVLLLFFGIRTRNITEQVYQEAIDAASDKQGLMTLKEILLCARRQRELEFKDFRHKFSHIDCDERGRVGFDKLGQLVGSLGITVSEATIRELVEDSEDTYFGLGRKDGALDFDEFVNFMLKLKTREGFSIAEVKQFKVVFDRFDDNNNGEVEVLELADMLRYLGRTVKLDELQVVISQVDFNGSGALEFEEFLRLMRIHREEEVNKIRKVYNRLVPEGTTFLPKAKLSEAMATLGFSGESVSLVKLRAKASGRRQSLQAQATGRLEDAGDSITFEQFLQWVDDNRAMKVNEQRRCAGFSSTELDSFQMKFTELDHQGTGVMDIRHLGPLLERIGLPALATAEERNLLLADLEKARETATNLGVQDVGEKGEGFSFWVLVQLLRIQFSRDDVKVLDRESEAVSEAMFSQGEVDAFRESFVSWCERQERHGSAANEAADQESAENRIKELYKDTLVSLIRSLGVNIDNDQRKRLDRKIEELNPNSKLDFPDFLRLMRWMVAVDFGGINGR